MSGLFDPITIGTLTLRNRLMRSATAERVADPRTGEPSLRQGALYRALAEGGVGLIVTGHAYVDRAGKCHPEMASIAEDAMIPAWRVAVRPAQEAGARVMMQINYGGAGADPRISPQPLSPSGIATNPRNPPRAMREEDIRHVIAGFGQAARRAREAGLDGVQFHGAHGYLISQFLTPSTNQRTDAWGGDAGRRGAFLRAVIAEVRGLVGNDYPVWIKLGVAGNAASGLAAEEGAQAAALCASQGVDCVEISHAVGEPEDLANGEAHFLPWAHVVRRAVGAAYPLALVNGFRSRQAMEDVLASGIVQLISLCRPLILEPDLPNTLRADPLARARCVSCNHCWPEAEGQGSACHNPKLQRAGQVVP